MDLSGVEDEEILAGCGRVVGVGAVFGTDGCVPHKEGS